MKNDFAVFILTHGRPDNVVTYKTLRRAGYTGQIYLLVDDEDRLSEKYIENYGDEVIIFNKREAADITDAGDNFKKRNSVIYARNKNFEIAKNMGLKYFWQLDDDYDFFRWRITPDGKFMSSGYWLADLDSVLKAMVNFMESSQIHCCAFTQGGDWIGGESGTPMKRFHSGKLMRKVMNSFLFCVDRPLKFYGRMNDDVNMYVVNGMRGMVFITLPQIMLNQASTQQNEGGLTEMYLELGTYVKSFYTVMFAPSCTKINMMGRNARRLHHSIKWKFATPQILDEKHRKPR